MAFAPAIDTGCRCFIFLSVCATLCALCLRVQSSMATASWIDRSNWFAPTGVNPCLATMAITSFHQFFAAPLQCSADWCNAMTLTMMRRQWDPGMPKHSTSGRSNRRHTNQWSLTERLTDHIRRPTHRRPVNGLAWAFDMINNTVTIDNTLVELQTVQVPLSFHPACHVNAHNDGAAPTVDRDPFPLRPTRPMVSIQSLLQCFHPVSSRPTVPNIQQCRNNLPSPSSS